ncbi:sigma-54-dependent Fis family transcriptional regulator [uncultured Mailhella sp.]|uniref:sigma-54 interaction domain-containing protein n=1 Tax=uncultured Mailhella sp. TaxID=1981031 RepID=UPI0025D364AD|nr:sigma-54 dependent transcriptional regulator [uncultured Mailhella sp.]
MENKGTDSLLPLLTDLCGELALGKHADTDRLFDLTRTGAAPDELVRLAEAFGMMLVRVEAREFQNSQLIQQLRTKNAELEALHRVLVQKNDELQKSVEALYSPGNGIIGQSEPMRRVFDLARSIARRPINTLILGPTGTGKEVLARFLHHQSPRSRGPFIAVNCTAIPDTLFESAMFGIEKGVATGVSSRKGLVEEASGGTLFLDELAEMSLANQAKLLRVLEQREVVRVGSAHPVPVDILLVSATNVNLEEAVKEGRFREDLFYRVNVVELKLLPLCERGDDIVLLAQSFLERFCAEMGRDRLSLSEAAQGLLLRYAWPGNVRELNNEMKRAAALTPGNVVELRNLSSRILESDAGREYLCHHEEISETERSAMPLNLQKAEAMLIRRALEQAGGRKVKAAELLGITREGLRKKLQRMAEENA